MTIILIIVMNKPTSNRKKRPVIDYKTAGKEAYKRFCQQNPGVQITCKDFRTIVRAFNTEMREHILQTGDRLKVGMLGSFSINKKKTRRFVELKTGEQYIILPVDWKKSKQLGKRVYHLNHHSDGYRYSWIWFRDDARSRFSDIWYFKAARPSSRRITDYVKLGNDFCERYKQWESMKSLARRHTSVLL